MRVTRTCVWGAVCAAAGISGCVGAPDEALSELGSGQSAQEIAVGNITQQHSLFTASAPVCGVANENGSVTVNCPSGQTIVAVDFASYGAPSGTCGSWVAGSCHATASTTVVSEACVGRASCTVAGTNAAFGDPCDGTPKQLAFQVSCAAAPGGSTPPVPPGGSAPPPSGGTASRPASNTGTGFFASRGKIYDANGTEFRMRGLNQTHWWAGIGEEAIASIAQVKANTVRVVFGPDAGASTPALRESIVRQYIAQRIIPVVEYHNGTCIDDPAVLDAAVDLWLGPDKAWLQSLERYVILNITNEWGPNSTVWRDAYKSAVLRLRQGGVKNLLMIDAGGACGQLAESVETWGNEIFESDPEKNLSFSIHMYGFWVDPGSPAAGSWDGRQPYDVDAELGRLVATGLPIVVGEFSWQGHSAVTYTTAAAVASYEKHGVGWLAWMWNNPGGDATVNMAKATVYTSPTDLTDFGRLLVDSPTFGMKAQARPATVF